jgi:hypothetical protein
MPDIDDPAGHVSGLTEIRVDTSGVDRFAGTVEAEVNANFTPQAGRLMAVYEPGAFFGVNHVSADVAAARRAHTECLRAAADQLVGYIDASKILVDAARTVSARYRGVDALAAANANEVELALADAVNRAGAARAAVVPAAHEPGNLL